MYVYIYTVYIINTHTHTTHTYTHTHTRTHTHIHVDFVKKKERKEKPFQIIFLSFLRLTFSVSAHRTTKIMSQRRKHHIPSPSPASSTKSLYQ